VTTFPPSTGTLNEYAWHFVRAFQQKREIREIIVLADELARPEPELPNQINGISLQIQRCWQFNRWDTAQRLMREIEQINPDAVLFNLQFATFGNRRIPAALALLTPALVRQKGIPSIVLLHNIMDTVDLKQAGFAGNQLINWLTKFAGRIITRQLLRADLVAVTIPRYVEILEQTYAATNVLLAPHGAFETPPPPTAPSTDCWRFLAFGKFGTYKKVETLIEAFAQVQTKHQQPMELVIAGSDSPNAAGYLNTVQQQYAHVPNVLFTGYVPEEAVAGLFQSATAVVFPYTSTTGSSGVLHQAGSYGRAAILPNLGDLADIISEEGFDGVFFEPENVTSLALALEQLLLDPARCHALGMQNYAAACGLPISDVADWYLLHLQTLLRQPAIAPRFQQEVL